LLSNFSQEMLLRKAHDRLTLVFIAFLILFALSVIFSESAETWILGSPLKYRSPDQPVILIFLFGNQQS